MKQTFSLTILLLFSLLKIIDCELKETTTSAFLEDCLSAHNKYRRLHGSERLVEDPKISDFAAFRLRRMLSRGELTKESLQRLSEVYGESFYWYHDVSGHHNCRDATKYWYDGYKSYDYNEPGFSQKSGGFTQIVWRSTRQLGCARVTGLSRESVYETYILCNYYPAGNINGKYPYNVYPRVDDERNAFESPISIGSISTGSILV